MDDTGFLVTANKGISIKFANGCEVSVQWGTGNYSSNRSTFADITHGEPVPRSALAEVAAWDSDGEYITMPGWVDLVGAYQTPEEVAAFIAHIATREG
jgi:hypothetical protein